jgi:hypothetical protein
VFFFWEDEDDHRTDCNFDIKFQDECKSSIVFHYLVKSEKNVLLYGDGGGGGGGSCGGFGAPGGRGGTLHRLVSYTLYGIYERDVLRSYGIETNVCIHPAHT